MISDHPITPVLMAFFAAVLWGLWWIPIRYLESVGLDGAWGSVAMNCGAALVVGMWMPLARARPMITVRGFAGAVLVGVAVTTYSAALTVGEVVRVILLFYLAPAWGKVIEWAFMEQPWQWSTTFALAASLGGAYLVLGGDVNAGSITLADVLAVLSGMAWAAGAALIFTGKGSRPLSLTLVTAISAAVLGLLFISLDPGTAFGGRTTAPGMATGAVFGAIYVLPILALTLWSAQRLSPAIISFLLTAEILSGVVSGALLLDEPFGGMQTAGACLIVFAALSQVIPMILKQHRSA